MKILRKSIIGFLLIMFPVTTISGQIIEEEVGEAYEHSGHAAHWSIYIPISALVVGAVYFAVCDRTAHEGSSSNTKDALGSIMNPKRIGSMRYGRKNSRGYSSSRPSSNHGSYSHS